MHQACRNQTWPAENLREKSQQQKLLRVAQQLNMISTHLVANKVFSTEPVLSHFKTNA
jgi:hypothetical protein